MEKIVDNTDSAADRYKEYYARFIELAAHDLQAPLRKLSVLTERLVSRYEKDTDPDVQQYVTRIHTCLDDMRSLIDGFSSLAVAIPDTMQPVSCHLEEIIHNLTRELGPVIKEKKSIISISSLPVFEGDVVQYRQLFRNILDNALRYHKENSQAQINISSSVATEDEKLAFNLPGDRKYYKIEITDNGIGFNGEDAENIFRPLVRLHGKSSFTGNGLSLAVCKQIAGNHQGIIYANGTENEGACFTLLLPEKL